MTTISAPSVKESINELIYSWQKLLKKRGVSRFSLIFVFEIIRKIKREKKKKKKKKKGKKRNKK